MFLRTKSGVGLANSGIAFCRKTQRVYVDDGPKGRK